MRIEMKVTDLQKMKIMVCTPMYGGQCQGSYTKSCLDLAAIAATHKIDIKFFYLFNESLIQRARTYMCDEFMRSDSTHLMFIDADIEFNPVDVLALAYLDKDIIGAPYAKKTIAWEKIKRAVETGRAEDPNELNKFVGDHVFNPLPGSSMRVDEMAEVLEIGTGFMMIKRSTFERFKEAYPELEITPDHNRTEHFNGNRKIHMYFDCMIDPVSNRYLSEDYAFCQRARAAGMSVWLCPWIHLKHTGMFIFGGSLPDVLSLGNVDVVTPGTVPAPAADVPQALPAVSAAPVVPELTRQQRRALERKLTPAV
jgi:hypothetical protein